MYSSYLLTVGRIFNFRCWLGFFFLNYNILLPHIIYEFYNETNFGQENVTWRFGPKRYEKSGFAALLLIFLVQQRCAIPILVVSDFSQWLMVIIAFLMIRDLCNLQKAGKYQPWNTYFPAYSMNSHFCYLLHKSEIISRIFAFIVFFFYGPVAKPLSNTSVATRRLTFYKELLRLSMMWVKWGELLLSNNFFLPITYQKVYF